MGGAVCIIPARGGSKRLPGKNVRSFHGRPMIAWSIDAARRSDLFERVVVSTDDDAIAEVATTEGAEVPFRRAPELSDDHTPTNPVVADATARLGLSDDTAVCCLYATAPFVEPEDLRRGRDRLAGGDVDFVFSATTYAFPVQRAMRLAADGTAEALFPEHAGTRSQDLPEVVHDAGQFYWGRARSFADHPVLFAAATAAVLLPRTRVQDIDTPEDWDRAEQLFATARTGR